MADTDEYRSGDPIRQRTVHDEGLLTFLSVPLMSGSKAMGCIDLFRREVRPFDDRQIALVETFAAQAVIAIESVRQFRELQTRLEREAATSGILEVISQSRDDDQPVFEVILEHAARLCATSYASLHLVDERRENWILTAARSNHHRSFKIGEAFPLPASRTAAATSILKARVVHIEDLADDDLYRQGDPVRVRTVDEEGARTMLVVPLITGGLAIGCITLRRNEVRPFSADQIALVESFAAQAVIAIENVRQFRELQTRLEREEANRAILQVISGSRADELPVFDTILESSRRLCRVDMCALFMVTADPDTMVLAAFAGKTLSAFEAGVSTASLDSQQNISLAVRENRTIHIEDMQDSELYRAGDSMRRRIVDDEGMHSQLVIPLYSGDTPIGVFGLYRQRVERFAEREITLLETFAAQAVIAIENVRQFRELQTRLEREAASKEILQVISQSRDDERPVFQVIIDNATQLCKADFSCLFIANTERTEMRVGAQSGTSLKFADFAEDTPLPVDPVQSQTAQSLLEMRTIQIKDAREDPIYLAGQPHRVFAVDVEGVRTLLTVPLVSGGRGVGVMFIYRREVRPFTDDEIALVETFAAQAVIAIENVRQFRELQTRLEREEANRAILQVISGSRADELPVFDTILESSRRLCRVDMCHLTMVRADPDSMTLAAYSGKKLNVFEVGVTTVSLDSQQNISVAVRENRTIHTEDMQDSELYRSGDSMRRMIVDDEGMHTQLVIPLYSGDTPIGAFSLYRQRVERFAEREITLLETFAAQAVIAIENVRQFREIGERNTQIEALNTSLETRVEEQVGEIERMGRLKRFLSPQVANAVISSGDEGILSSHRALIGILFCDIRGFTAFCETAEPEETIEFLQTYHEEMGKLINAHGAGVDHRWGDGIMVIFNDPFPCEDPAGDALRLALAMREKMEEICLRWKRLGHRLGFGVGISLGYATVGMVGSEGRFDYTANGTAVNMAARLCDHAEDGEILLSPRAYTAVEDDFAAETLGEMTFKGIRQPVEVFRVVDASAQTSPP
jgi:GAF domain-containing protein